MEPIYDGIDALIAKYLSGETSPEEVQTLEQWRNAQAANEQYFAQMQKIWTIPAATANAHFDTEAALKRVKTQIATPARPNTLRINWYKTGIAATLALLLAAGLWLFNREGAENTVAVSLEAPPEQVLTDTLQDGSVVTLNRNSGLTAAGQYNQKERRLRLRGEGFFEVAPDAQRPFIVMVHDLEVRAVGTAFNVDNHSQPGKVMVTVTHGKVMLQSGQAQQFLVMGEMAEYDQNTHLIQRKSAPQPANTLAYKNRIFRFDATPLKEVVQQLNHAYGISIVVQNPALESCLLTARYNNLPINRVMELIAASFSIQVTRQTDGGYSLDGKSCGE